MFRAGTFLFFLRQRGGRTQKILTAWVKSWLLLSQMQSSRRRLCRHELSSVHVLWFALFCADLLKDWMYVLSIQIHALGRETGRIVPEYLKEPVSRVSGH